MSNFETEREAEGDLRLKTRSKRPPRWRVVMLNDDYTTMEFVIEVLQHFFRKNNAEATKIMLTVHQRGRAEVGIYSRDIAQTKVAEVREHGRRKRQPLELIAEPCDDSENEA